MILPPILVCLPQLTGALALTLAAHAHHSGWFALRWFWAPAPSVLVALLLGVVAAVLLAGGSWLLFQVLCQQGRLLLRLEALEARRSPDGRASLDTPLSAGAAARAVEAL